MLQRAGDVADHEQSSKLMPTETDKRLLSTHLQVIRQATLATQSETKSETSIVNPYPVEFGYNHLNSCFNILRLLKNQEPEI
jgi:hypothetical protein